MFNPPNPNATGMNFNNPGATGMNFNNGRPGSNQGGASASLDPTNAQMPSIGASLVDQEAVSLAPNLMGKKKKKKAKKINPNAYMDDDNLELPGSGKSAKKVNLRQSSLANAGASIGHASSYNENA